MKNFAAPKKFENFRSRDGTGKIDPDYRQIDVKPRHRVPLQLTTSRARRARRRATLMVLSHLAEFGQNYSKVLFQTFKVDLNSIAYGFANRRLAEIFKSRESTRK